MNVSVYVATSLDGFIAREDGSLDWLRGSGPRPAEEERGYRVFMDSVDAIVMGRVTYETVRDFPTWPYASKPVIILSHREVVIPSALAGRVEPMSGPPAELVPRLRARGWQHLYVDGGKTIQGFLAAGLVRRLTLNRLPVLLGSGLPLFGPVPGDVRLQHIRTVVYPGGLVQSEYGAPGA